jgi:RND family efflux transporter MFP subunit
MELQKLSIDRSGAGSGAGRRRRRNPWWGRLIALAVVAALLWIFRAPLLARLDRWRLPTVEVVAVVRTTAMARASASGAAANGYVVARRRAALSADTPGRVVELNVEEGSVVQRGDVVARLFADEYEAALRRADADLAAGGNAVGAAQARVESAETRLAESRAGVTGAEASRDEAAAGLGLAELEAGRATELLAKGVDTRERSERADAELAQARARLAAAESTVVSRQKAVASAESEVEVARADRAQSQSSLASLTAGRDLAAATLDKTIVRAPFDGVIVLKDAEVGEVVSPNAQGGQSRGSVATMVDFASLEIQVELPETSLSSARVGEACEVFLDAFASERFAGRVDRIWPTANRQKASVEVRVVLAKIDPRMRPEMGARVVFTGAAEAAGPSEPAEEALMIPSDAVVRVDGVEGVFVLERDVARFRPVTLAAGAGRRRVVERGVAEGERVVLSPPARLADGDRVLIQGGT